MRRVLLLVCLIVSVVQLDWGRAQIYMWSSAASLLLIFYGELIRRRNIQRTATEGILKTGGAAFASKTCVPDLLPQEGRADHSESGARGASLQEIAMMQNNSG